MLIDVGDPTLNLALNACFVAILLLALLALIPWRLFGVARFSYRLRWLILPLILLAVSYEYLMPSRFDIRIDLLLLLPLYLLVLVASLARWRRGKRP